MSSATSSASCKNNFKNAYVIHQESIIINRPDDFFIFYFDKYFND
jgi:hypothetical protein